MTTPAPGATIAERYVVLAPLGEGGMGQVVRARDTKLDREVAVKVLAPHAVGDAKARERLVREARAAAKLAHAGIVHVYDVGETDDGGAFLVMELVRGETLRASSSAAECAPRNRSRSSSSARARSLSRIARGRCIAT
jgi:serine/threonine-protein kinase